MRQTEGEVGRQHQGMDRPGVQQVPEGSGEQGEMEKTGCKIIWGAPTTLAVKGLMMMMLRSEYILACQQFCRTNLYLTFHSASSFSSFFLFFFFF